MRLNTEARGLIVKLCRQHFGADARVWLFGSRLDDEALGGDIDLYIETTIAQETWLRAEAAFIWDFCSTQGEQKIDLIPVHPKQANLPIHQIARSNGVELGLWA